MNKVPWGANANTYGTGLLDKLFTTEELAKSTFSIGKKTLKKNSSSKPLLSPTRRNLIKGLVNYLTFSNSK